MKKISKIKRLFVLCLVFLLSINSFAAVVSDNDGSVFITKAEFDSLRNTFQSQIDAYNQGIDNKIDEAIATYLAGIKVEIEKNTSIIFNTWDDVSCFNGVIEPTYKVPNAELVAVIGSMYQPPTSFVKDIALSWKGNYIEAGTVQQALRPLVTGNKEGVESVCMKDLVWNGIAQAYDETYKIIRTWHHNTNSPHPGFLDQVDAYIFGGTLTDLTNIKLNGYYSNFEEEKSNVIDPTITWWWEPVGGGTRDTRLLNYSGFEFGVSNTSQVALKEYGGKQKLYNHIIQWDKTTTWCVSNELFTKTFRKNTKNTNTSKTLLNKLTQAQKMAYCGVQLNPAKASWEAAEASGTTWSGAVDFQAGVLTGSLIIDDVADAILPSIGMLPVDAAASTIKQYENSVDITFNNKLVTIPIATLEKGFPLLYATKDTKIHWEPTFSYVKAYNTATTTVENNNEIILKFSLGTFSNKDTIDSGSTVINVKNSDSGVEANTVKTNLRKVKVDFTMPNDGVVYVKWWSEVSTTTLFDKGWIATLDIKNCSNFRYRID